MAVRTTQTMSPTDTEAFVQANARWNFTVNVLTSSFFQLAMSFIFGSTVMSLYVSYLTDSAVLIGLIPAIQNTLFLLPQLLLARYTQTLAHKKSFVVRMSIGERLPYAVVALSIFLMPNAPKWLAYGILALSLMTATTSSGLGSPAWKSMIAKIIPVRRRGMLFGLSNAFGGLLGIGGAALSRQVFDRYAYPTSFGIAFALCLAAHVVSWTMMNLNREPRVEPTQQPPPAAEYWRRLPGLVREDENFKRYLISRMPTMLGTMGMAFYVVYAKDVFQISDAFAASLTMAALIGQTISTPLMGWLGDHKGNKLLSEFGSLLLLIAMILILLSPRASWLYLAFMLINASNAAGMISGINITMEFGPPEELATYSALASSISAVPVLLAPVLGGWLVDGLGYHVMFLVAIGLTAAGIGTMHLWVRDPREVWEEHQRAEVLAGS